MIHKIEIRKASSNINAGTNFQKCVPNLNWNAFSITANTSETITLAASQFNKKYEKVQPRCIVW
jgi:hypothetical protein